MFQLRGRVMSWTGTFLLLIVSSMSVAHLSSTAAAYGEASQQGPTPANTPAAASLATAHRPFACQPSAEGGAAEAPAAAPPQEDLAAMQQAGRVGGMALAQVSGAVPRMSASAATSPSHLPEATALRLSQSAATSPHVHRQPLAGAAPSGEEHTWFSQLQLKLPPLRCAFITAFSLHHMECNSKHRHSHRQTPLDAAGIGRTSSSVIGLMHDTSEPASRRQQSIAAYFGPQEQLEEESSPPLPRVVVTRGPHGEGTLPAPI